MQLDPKLMWTEEAEEDVLNLYYALSYRDLSLADRFISRIASRIRLLVAYPRLGVRKPEIFSSARMLVEGAYLILYETHPDEDDGAVEAIEIARIVRGTVDLGQIFNRKLATKKPPR